MDHFANVNGKLANIKVHHLCLWVLTSANLACLLQFQFQLISFCFSLKKNKTSKLTQFRKKQKVNLLLTGYLARKMKYVLIPANRSSSSLRSPHASSTWNWSPRKLRVRLDTCTLLYRKNSLFIWIGIMRTFKSHYNSLIDQYYHQVNVFMTR